MEVVGIAAACALLTLFCAGVVITYVRKKNTLAVLFLVAAMTFGVLALMQKDPEMLRAATEFVAGFIL